jgi:hypothetical protein
VLDKIFIILSNGALQHIFTYVQQYLDQPDGVTIPIQTIVYPPTFSKYFTSRIECTVNNIHVSATTLDWQNAIQLFVMQHLPEHPLALSLLYRRCWQYL